MFALARFAGLFLCCLLGFAFPASAQELTVNKIAAVVNGEMITLHELRMHTAAELARHRIKPDDPKAAEVTQEVLDTLINDILMRQEAKRYNLSVSDAELEEEIQRNIKGSGVSPQDFEAGLKRQSISMDMYKERLRNNLLRRRITNFMVSRKVFITPEEVSDYYHKHPEEFQGERTADFAIMILPEKVNVQQVYQQLKSGAVSFEDVAKEHSIERSAQQGGLVRGIPWEKMPPEMQKLLSSLDNGKLSPLLRTKGGFVVIRRDAVHEAKPLTLVEATPRIEEKLRMPLLEGRFKEYITQLRGKAVIDIRM